MKNVLALLVSPKTGPRSPLTWRPAVLGIGGYLVAYGVIRCFFGPQFFDWNPVFSPDGRRIAFNSSRHSGGDKHDEIYVMNADGTAVRRLTDNDAQDERPSFSPDGRQIAFESNRDGNREVYVMNADGSGQTRITNDPGDDHAPAFTADGRKIRFLRGGELYEAPTGGGEPVRLTKAPPAIVAVSPDGGKLAFSAGRHSDLHVMNLDRTGDVQLTDRYAYPPLVEPGSRREFLAGDSSLAFSPDGRILACESDRDGWDRWRIYRINVDGSGQTRLTNGDAHSPAFSWDGRRIAFTRNYEIWTMDLDGSNEKRVTRNLGIAGLFATR